VLVWQLVLHAVPASAWQRLLVLHHTSRADVSWLAMLLFVLLVLLMLQTRQALPCPKGTYKGGVSQAPSCTPCPTGITTAAAKSGSPTQCDRAVTAGYYVGTDNNNQKVAKPCAVNTYSTNGQSCTPCADYLQTAREAATSAAECLAPPGYGYDPSRASGPKTYQCPGGFYKVS
jgi:hypothetical protein